MSRASGSVLGGKIMSKSDVDVVVVGAGFSGMYLQKRLRDAGFSYRVLEAAGDVGGTWYWNRYPGARCDISTTDYQYTWDPELHEQWTWSEKHAGQPEILSYAQFVAKKHDLYSGIDFGVRVNHAEWDDNAKKWSIHTSTGETISCRHYVMATGCLSVPKEPDIPGTERFRGGVYVTGRWPMRASTSPAKRWPSSARDPRASSPSRTSPSKPAKSSFFNAPPTTPSPRSTDRLRNTASIG